MITLSNKKKVEIDLYKLSVADVRSLLDVKKKDHEGDEVLSKAVGMTPAELVALPFPDYRKITREFWKAVRNPLEDEEAEKNSLSESTSE